MELCKTDIKTIVRFLEAAARFYDQHATSTRERDRMRLINKLTNKLNAKLKQL